MGELTPDDVKHWDLTVIHQVFETAAKHRDAKHQLGEALANAKSKTAGWEGASGDAFREELGKTRADVNAAGRDSDGVHRAVQTAESWVSGAKVALDDVEASAAGLGWTVTQDWRIDPGPDGGIGLDGPTYQAELQTLQADLDNAKNDAQVADRDLALALRAAVGDAQVDSSGHQVGGLPATNDQPRDVGSQERPGVTDVNDPNVKWQDGFSPAKWKRSWQNPMLADNPPGYSGGPGPERDAAWQKYLAHFPQDGTRGLLPNPDAVSDPGLKTVGAAGTQLGTSYAWAGGDKSGPGKGDYAYNKDGSINKKDGAYTYDDPRRIGFDCSGLAEYAAGQVRPNEDIGGYTGAQLGSPHLQAVPLGQLPKPGDFVYYGSGTAEHVGIYVAPGVIINAPESGLPVELDHNNTTSNGSTVRVLRLH